MPTSQLPATDSAQEIHDLIGDDSTATFESDPKFMEPTPGSTGSSDNLQDRDDRADVQDEPALQMKSRTVDDDDDEDEEDDEDDDLEDDEADEEEDDADDEDDEDDDEDDEDDEDDDEDDEDDEEEDDEDEDDNADDEEEDDADEVAASSQAGEAGTFALRGLHDADGSDTEAPRTDDVQPALYEDPMNTEADVDQQNTNDVADKALRMHSLPAAHSTPSIGALAAR